MKKIIYIIIFLNFHLIANHQSNNNLINREVINHQTIAHSGLILLSDILQLSNQIRISTIDGFLWFPTINGLDPSGNQDWIIMVDNHRMNLKTFDVININFLPININEIDSIEIVSSPHIYKSFFSNSGLIHIHTDNNKKNIIASIIGGNESGDPGPYHYISGMSSPNVEHMGGVAALNLKINKNKNYYYLAFNSSAYPMTDWSIINRLDNIFYTLELPGSGLHPFISKHSTLIGIDRKMKYSDISFLANYSYSDKYFLFFKPIGMEIPTKYNNGYLGFNYNNQLFRKSNLAYNLSYSFNKLSKYPNALEFNFDYNLKNLHTSLELATMILDSRLTMGIAFDRFKLNTDYNLRKSYYDIYKIFSSLHYKLSDYIDSKIDVMAIISSDKYSIKSSYSSALRFNDNNRVNLNVSYIEKLLNENSNLWYWQSLGYDLLDINYLSDTDYEKNKMFTIDIVWKNNSIDNTDIEFKNYFRSFKDNYFEDYSYTFNPDNDFILLDSLSIHTDQSLETVGLSISLKNKMNQRIEQSLSYDIQFGLSGGHLLSSIKNIPSQSLKYHLMYSVADNFSVWMRFNYLSDSFWDDYQMIDGVVYATVIGEDLSYSDWIDSFNLIDIGFQRWFLDRKIKTNLFLRNILNQNYRYHPIGVSFDFSMYLEFVFYPL
tara:strand:- start:460 stop:2439 length:1980 start_codon:yes stop_codon:yes gene_type:complete